MSKTKGHDYSTLLIWAAALVTVVRYAAAFVVSDSGTLDTSFNGVMEVAMLLSGLGMGILDVIGGTYLFTGWQKKMPKNGEKWQFKFKVLTAFTVGLIVNGILILIPFTVSRVAHISMYDVLGSDKNSLFLFGWATVVNVAPYLLIGGVAVGNQIVSVNLPETFRKVSDSRSEGFGKFPANWRQARKLLTDEEVKAIAIDQTKNISFHYELDERTARNWRKYAQEEISK